MMFNGLIKFLCKRNDGLILSYKALRRLIGILGILLPFINILGGKIISNIPIQESISIYYYTNMRDFFVGLLFIVSIFLITYKGYNSLDFIITTITGFSGLGIALFPCSNIELILNQRVGIFQLTSGISNKIHLICAAIFFTLLAVNSLFLFTQKNIEKVTPQKKIRNSVYVVCGITILISILGILLSNLLLPDEQIFKYRIILISETIALSAFGISWLIKGETLFTDK
jgi:hypothetical protein